MRINLFDFETKTNQVIGRQLWMYHGELSRLHGELVGRQPLDRLGAGPGQPQLRHRPLRLQGQHAAPGHLRLLQRRAARLRSRRQIPLLPHGPHLRARSTASWTTPGSTPTPPVLAAVPLRKDVPSPLAPRNDEEGDKDERQEGGRREEGRRQGRQAEGRRQEDGRRRPSEPTRPTKPKDEKKDGQEEGRETQAGGDRPRGLRGARGDPAAQGRALRQTWPPSPASCFTAACRASAPATRRTPVVFYDLEKREEKTRHRRRGRLRALRQPREAARAQRQRLRHHRAQGRPEAGQEDRHRRLRGARLTRWPSGGRSSPTPGGWSATTSTTRACTAWTGTRCAQRYGKLLEDAVTRWDVNYVHRRTDRRTERLAHLPQRRRCRERPRRGRGLPGLRFRARERRLPDQAHRQGGAVGQRSALAAAAAGRDQRARRRLPAGRERRTARRDARTRGPPSRAWPTSRCS